MSFLYMAPLQVEMFYYVTIYLTRYITLLPDPQFGILDIHRVKSCLALYAVLKADRIIITKFATSYVSGFNETKAACCGLGYLNAKVPCLPVSSYCSNRRDHVFWDLFHPTEATHRILVEHLFQGSTYTVPMNVEELVSL